MSGYCRAEIGDTPKLATKNSAHISRARVEYMISALHDDTNPPDLDQQWLILATPWPELLDQLSDRGSNLPVNTLARPRALCRVSCRKFICVVQITENTMFELARLLQFKRVLCTAFCGYATRGRFCARRRRGYLNINSNRLIANSEFHVGIIIKIISNTTSTLHLHNDFALSILPRHRNRQVAHYPSLIHQHHR